MKQFDALLVKKPNRNVFDLSHEVKLTCDMGELIPVLTQEVYPGDTFKSNSEILVRFAPLLAPIMHRIDVYFHAFFVPNRIIWDDWEKFITHKDKGVDTVEEVPTFTITDSNKSAFYKGTLADYLGIPPTDGLSISKEYEINALPFLAYQKIWWDYYRDQNLQHPEEDFDFIQDSFTETTELRLRAWERDYFTSCLPWAQKGEEVEFSIGSTADLIMKAYPHTPQKLYVGADGSSPVTSPLSNSSLDYMVDSTPDYLTLDVSTTHEVDLSSATTVSVNDFRIALRLQEWMEKNARMGSRYVELLLAHFGVRSSDARLQRPEYLGGGKQAVTISEVVSTVASRSNASGTEDDILAPQGELAGHAISVGKSNFFKKYFEEHGFVVGIMSIKPKSAYQNGIHKMFWRLDYLDYMWPSFAQLGEQEVYVKELCVDYQDDHGKSEDVFGYQSRYAELKFMDSRVCADMRDDYDHYHLGRQFSIGSGSPVLNESFITCEPDKRIFAVEEQDLDSLIVQIYHSLHVIRALPYFNVPGII